MATCQLTVLYNSSPVLVCVPCPGSLEVLAYKLSSDACYSCHGDIL